MRVLVVRVNILEKKSTIIWIKLKKDEVQVDKGVLRNVIEVFRKVVLWNKRKITEDDIGDMKIAQEVKLTDEARSPDFNWRDVTVWLKPLKADPEFLKKKQSGLKLYLRLHVL